MKFEIIDYPIEGHDVDVEVDFDYFENSTRQKVKINKITIISDTVTSSFSADQFTDRFGYDEFDNLETRICLNMHHEYFMLDNYNSEEW